ncbi:MAG: hypothetical protein H6832_11065 [Planctomycetes bacterium]|nr:hypothetical protein [Planctomycetota bacterium]MCB9891163.1 hypothetical protein [Planctomycetota bacterium]MCB9918930.1 hypothetical protein [Planctomycetota bacterium]
MIITWFELFMIADGLFAVSLLVTRKRVEWLRVSAIVLMICGFLGISSLHFYDLIDFRGGPDHLTWLSAAPYLASIAIGAAFLAAGRKRQVARARSARR